MYRLFLIFVLIASLQSCASRSSSFASLESDFAIIYPDEESSSKLLTGSIFDNGNVLYPAGRAYKAGKVKIGDIVTVILNETAQASRITGLTTERASANNVIGADILGGGPFFNGLGTEGTTISSAGTGTAGQSASLTGSISVAVVDVMKNGNLIVFGEKKLGLNEGSEMIVVKGVIRPDDIMPNNTVLSTRLANAQFSYSGVGELARATKGPWGSNVLFSLWPF